MGKAIDDMGSSNDAYFRTCTAASATDDGGQVNLDSRHEVFALSLALNCRPIDVYLAVAAVGDRLRDVRAWIARSSSRRGDASHDRRAVRGTASLPPIRM